MSLVTGTAFLAIVYILGYSYLKKEIPAWSLRGFGKLQNDWGFVYAMSVAVGYIASLAVYFNTDNNVYAMAMTGIFAAAGTAVGYSDAVTMKAPQEITDFAFRLLVPGAILGIAFNLVPMQGYTFFQGFPFFLNPAVDATVQMLLFLVIPTILVFSNMGFGDVRFLYIAGWGASWWMGINSFVYIFGAAAALQLVCSLVLGRIFNWGEMRPQKKSWLNPKGKERRATPFLPVLAITFIAGLVLAS
jgi:hypothetical protein